MKLKDIADKKQNAAAVQSAINDTAEEQGLVADDLAKGKYIKDNSKEAKARYGAAIEKAQTGTIAKVNPWGGDYVRERHVDDKEDIVRTIKNSDGSTTNFTKGGGKYTEFKNGRIGVLSSTGQRYMATRLADGDIDYDQGDLEQPRFQSPIEQLAYTPAPRSQQNTPVAAPVTAPVVTTPPRTTGTGGGGGARTQARKKITPAVVNVQQKDIPKDFLKTKPQEFAPISKEEQAKMRASIDKYYSETGKPKEKQKFPWMQAANSLIPYLRPTDQMDLDPNQLSPEMYALSQNQLEPVSAQGYHPQLITPSNISLQAGRNANQADFRSLQRLVGNNPEALAALAAKEYAANAQSFGQEAGINQAAQMQAANQNIGTMNDAQLKNLGIFDTQYQRQSQAKSNTKAVTQAALSSIADKIAKNKLENRTLGTYENLYNYRFDNQNRAQNMNPLLDVDSMIANAGNATPEELKAYATIKEEQAKKTKAKSRNGSIVKAMKNL